jgi:hypothetical protein
MHVCMLICMKVWMMFIFFTKYPSDCVCFYVCMHACMHACAYISACMHENSVRRNIHVLYVQNISPIGLVKKIILGLR